MQTITRTARYWGPLLAGFICLIVALFVGPTVAWLLLILAAGLILDAATALWAQAMGTGGLSTHRQ